MAPLKGKAGPLGGEGKIVEADTTYIGGKEKNKHRSKHKKGNLGGKGKQVVHSLVERGGHVRSDHIANVSGKTLRPVVMKQVHRSSSFMTDEGGEYYWIGKEFTRHEKVNHAAGEYVRGDAHSNTVEGYFATQYSRSDAGPQVPKAWNTSTRVPLSLTAMCTSTAGSSGLSTVGSHRT
jgi:hypothetical protein